MVFQSHFLNGSNKLKGIGCNANAMPRFIYWAESDRESFKALMGDCPCSGRAVKEEREGEVDEERKT
jgi:hypothetical protein